MTRPTTVDEYIAGFFGDAAERLKELRALSREAAPEDDGVTWV